MIVIIFLCKTKTIKSKQFFISYTTYDISMQYMQALYIKQTFCNENKTEHSKQHTHADVHTVHT